MSESVMIVVDVEADGPCPGLYSMVSVGAVVVERPTETARSFFGQMKPFWGTSRYEERALKVCGVTREEHLAYPCPHDTMTTFDHWVRNVICASGDKKPVFVSDNPGFDYAFVNYYFHQTTFANPFGHSARRIGDIYSGLMKDVRAGSKWKKFRKTAHTHNPVDDARGNVEALIHFADEHGLAL